MKILIPYVLILISTSLLAQPDRQKFHRNSFEENIMFLWGQRDQLGPIHKASEGFHKLKISYPGEKSWVSLLMHSCFIRGYFQGEHPVDRNNFFRYGFELGEQALQTNNVFAQSINQESNIQKTVKVFGVEDVPLLYWTAVNIAEHMKVDSKFDSAKYKDKMLAYISRVGELKPDYFFGAVPRFWANYNLDPTQPNGLDVNKRMKYLETSLKMAPEFIGTKILIAEALYSETGDVKAFKKSLQEVINDHTYDHHSDIGPENRMEKIRAKRILDKI